MMKIGTGPVAGWAWAGGLAALCGWLAGCGALRDADGRGRGRSAEFRQPPVVALEKQAFRIDFEAAMPTDCAVWITGPDGRAIRHLVAGRLGEPDAVPPLAPGSLKQSVVWDGRDNAGTLVADPLTCTARVGLGMTAAFERIIGREPQWLGAIYALAASGAGELFAYCSSGISVLDRQGRYLRQVAPAPAGFPADRLQGLEPVTLADGTVFFRRGYALPGNAIGSMAVAPNGDLLLPGVARYARRLTRIGPDGSVAADAFRTRLTSFADVGLLFLACSPDGRNLYFTGAEPGYLGDDFRETSYRHAIYRLDLRSDGPAEILTGDDENTGWEGFMLSQPRGLAVDAAGLLYVCNQTRERPGDTNGVGDITVYSPRGAKRRSIPVDYPQQVAVHPKTGQLYVLAGREESLVRDGVEYPPRARETRLVRLSADGREEQSRRIEDAFVRVRKNTRFPDYRVTMAVDFSGPEPVVWLGLAFPQPRAARWSLLRIEDLGSRFGEPVDVCPKPAGALPDQPMHLALDRERDILYVNDESSRLLRFRGDGTPLPPFTVQSESDGKTNRYSICEPAVGPGGQVYVLGWTGYGYRDNRILRLDPEGRLLPLPAAEADGGVKVRHVMKASTGSTARGLAVGPRGDIYVTYYDTERPADAEPPEAWDRGYRLTQAVAHFGPGGRLVNPRHIAHLRTGGQGVRVDRAGCLYVGDNFMPIGVSYPRDFAAVLDDPLKRPYPARRPDGEFDPTLIGSIVDGLKRPEPVRLASGGFDPLIRFMGSVIKFGPGGGRIFGLPEDDATPPARRPAGDLWKPVPSTQWFLFNNHRLCVEGAQWQYHGVSPMPAEYQGVTHVERCVCRGARFDLDEFDRVFVPDALRSRISVLDSGGRTLAHIGERGNADHAGPAIGLSEPMWVAAAADRLYIGDGVAARIVKVRLGYSAEAACPVGGVKAAAAGR